MTSRFKLEYDIKNRHIGPLTFQFPKILKDWVKVIKERGAVNIKISEVIKKEPRKEDY